MQQGISVYTCRKKRRATQSTAGFSLMELMIVFVVLAVLTAVSLPYLYSSRTLYRSEDQALKIMDLMREAGQLALTKRRTFRLEIDLTDNALLIIDENGTGASDDALVKSIPLDPTGEVRMDTIPTGVTKPDPPDYNDAVFAADAIGHQRDSGPVIGHNVWAARFKSNGSAVNAADIPISVNLYLWPPKAAGDNAPRRISEVRAITMFGGSGAVRYWKYDGAKFLPY